MYLSLDLAHSLCSLSLPWLQLWTQHTTIFPGLGFFLLLPLDQCKQSGFTCALRLSSLPFPSEKVSVPRWRVRGEDPAEAPVLPSWFLFLSFRSEPWDRPFLIFYKQPRHSQGPQWTNLKDTWTCLFLCPPQRFLPSHHSHLAYINFLTILAQILLMLVLTISGEYIFSLPSAIIST